MSYINIRVKGLEQLTTQLDAYMKNLAANLQEGCNEAVTLIRTTANETIAPIDTGKMIESSFDKQIKVQGGVGAECIYAVPYAEYVETVEEHRHGAEYNEYYAERIKAGYDHLRKPEESSQFLEITAREQLNNVQEIFQNKVDKTTI